MRTHARIATCVLNNRLFGNVWVFWYAHIWCIHTCDGNLAPIHTHTHKPKTHDIVVNNIITPCTIAWRYAMVSRLINYMCEISAQIATLVHTIKLTMNSFSMGGTHTFTHAICAGTMHNRGIVWAFMLCIYIYIYTVMRWWDTCVLTLEYA